jgi:selenocysteine lyase/cysteine desulfurase
MLSDDSRHADFPSLAGRTYLNTAAEGIPPRVVNDALMQYTRDKQLGMDGRAAHETWWQAARTEVGQLYGLTADEIGICSCSSEAFNLAALALPLGPADEVVINDLDFPAGATAWLQSAWTGRVRVWKSRDGALRVEDLIPLLKPRTRLVSTSLVSFYNGFRIPLNALVETVRKHSSAMLAVDVTQALGRVTMDLSGVDLIISSTHKWLLASHGGGLVGVPQHRADEWTVPAGGWFNLQDAFGADRFERVEPKPGAASFCVGMPNYPAVYAIAAAAKYLRGCQVSAIEAHADPLVRACFDGLKSLPLELLTPDEPGAVAGIIAFRHAKAEQIYQYLHQYNVHVMCHAGRLRVALHGYNTMADVERFLKLLHEALAHV